MAENISIKVSVTGGAGVIDELTRIKQLTGELNKTDVKIPVDTKAVYALSLLYEAQAKAKKADDALAISTNKLAMEQAKAEAAESRRAQQEIKSQMQTEKFANKTKEAGEAAKEAGDLFKRMGDQVKTAVANFIIQKPIQELKEALNTLKEVDTQLRTIQKVTGATAEEVDKLGAAAYSTASKYGIAADQYLEAVAAFSRAGYKEASADLAELSMKTQLVGDTNAETANQFLLAVDAAYKLKGNISDLNHVIDAANTIDNNYASTIEKIAEGMGLVSSVAANYGVSTDQLSAALGTITANTQRSGSEAARALRYIMIQLAGNVGAVLDEETGDVLTKDVSKATEKILAQYSVATRELKNGIEELRNPMDIIGELAERFKSGSLNAAELNDIVSQIGGKRQANSLLALIRDWETYEKMLDDVANSAGSADKEVSVMLTSWESKVNILKNTWTEFVAKSVDTGFIKGLLDAGTWLLNTFDNLGNVISFVVDALLVFKSSEIIGFFKNTFLGAIQNIGAAFQSVGANIQVATVSQEGLAAATDGATGAIEAQSAAVNNASSASSGWLAILGLVLMTLQAVGRMAQSAAEAEENEAASAKEKAAQYTDAANKVENLGKKYSELNEKLNNGLDKTEYLEGVFEIQKDIVDTVGEQAKGIDLVNGKYEEQVEAINGVVDGLKEATLEEMRRNSVIASRKGWSASENEHPWYEQFVNPMNLPQIVIDSFKQNQATDVAWLEALDVYNELGGGYQGAHWNGVAADSLTAIFKGAFTFSSNAMEAEQQISALMRDFEKAGHTGTAGWTYLNNLLTEASGAANEARKDLLEWARAEVEANEGHIAGLSKYSKYQALALQQAKTEYWDLKNAAEEAGEAQEEAWSTIADHVNDAKNAVDEFNSAIGNEADSAYQSLAGVLDKMAEAVDKGYFGSNAFQMGAEMLLNTDVIESFGTDYERLWEYINEHPLLKSFGDTEDEGRALLEYIQTVGQEYETAEGTAKVLLDTNGNVIAAVREMGDTFDYYIGNEAIPAISAMSGATEEAIGSMTSALDMFGQESKDFEAELNVNTDEANKNIEETGDKSEETKEDISEEVEMNVDNQAALDAIQTVQDKLWDVTSKAWVINVAVNSTGSVPTAKNMAGSQFRRASGTEHAQGGPTLVNDQPGGYNPELIVQDGEAFIAGGGHPTVIDLAPGAQVYNAADTRAILNNAFFDGTIPALASGSGIKRYSATSKYSKSGKSSSTSTSSKKTTKTSDEGTQAAVEAQTELTKEQLDTQKKQLKIQEAQDKVAEKQLALEQAKQDLETAKNERTVRYYNEQKKQWEWMADKEAVKKAEEDLAKAQQDLKDAENALAEAINNLAVAVNNNAAATNAATAAATGGGSKSGGSKSGGSGGKSTEQKIAEVAAANGAKDKAGIQQAVDGYVAKPLTSPNVTYLETEQKIKEVAAANNAKNKAGIQYADPNYVAKPIATAKSSAPKSTSAKTVETHKWSGGPGNVNMYYDDGGLASGKGILAKAIDQPEAVLDDELTSKILSPTSNRQFESFVEGVGMMFGMAKRLDSKVNGAGGGSITDNSGTRYYVNGIKIGAKEAETMPLSKVLSVLPIYANKNS